MRAARRQRVVERGRDQHLDDRLAAPAELRAHRYKRDPCSRALGARMMPAVWWSAHVCPGSAVKLGSSESATFMRKVPEPQRHPCMRRRNAGSRASAAIIRGIEKLGIDVGGHCGGADRRAHPRAPRRLPGRLSTMTSRTGASVSISTPWLAAALRHGLGDRTHAADGVPPGALLAVHLAEGVVQQHIAGAGRVGAGVIADDGVEAEPGLHQLALEPAVEIVAGRFREQVVQTCADFPWKGGAAGCRCGRH